VISIPTYYSYDVYKVNNFTIGRLLSKYSLLTAGGAAQLAANRKCENMLAFLPTILFPANRLRNSGRTQLHDG